MTAEGQFGYAVLRRDLVKGAAALGAGVAYAGALALGSRSVAAVPATVTREDVTLFQRSPQKVAALEAAVGEMQARSAKDPADPKGWLVNANAHATYCSRPGVDDPDQIHFCWWFLAWHRAYITVTERKLRALSGDASIAFPYWNWCSDRAIPSSFARTGSPLAAAIRDTPPRRIVDSEVDYFPKDPAKARLVVAALGAASFEATRAAHIGSSFGGIARPNKAGPSGKPAYGNNRLEGVPHGPIHNYVGGDMSDFETAGRDPIFFTHHGNLDRLWEIWRKDPTHRNTEPGSDEFKTHPFPFTWLDGTTIMVTAGETLDTTTLGYVYDSLDVLRPTLAATVQVTENDEAQLPAIATARVSVPATVSQLAADGKRYSLVISGVEPPDRPMTVGVYVKPASDSSPGPGVAVGSFAAVRSGGRIQLPETELRFDITGILKQLGSGELSVSLLPYALGAKQGEPYEAFRYQDMRIVSGE